MQENYILTESNPQSNSLDAFICLGMISNYGKLRHFSTQESPKKRLSKLLQFVHSDVFKMDNQQGPTV